VLLLLCPCCHLLADVQPWCSGATHNDNNNDNNNNNGNVKVIPIQAAQEPTWHKERRPCWFGSDWMTGPGPHLEHLDEGHTEVHVSSIAPPQHHCKQTAHWKHTPAAGTKQQQPCYEHGRRCPEAACNLQSIAHVTGNCCFTVGTGLQKHLLLLLLLL
jgi:hypothetical protein